MTPRLALALVLTGGCWTVATEPGNLFVCTGCPTLRCEADGSCWTPAVAPLPDGGPPAPPDAGPPDAGPNRDGGLPPIDAGVDGGAPDGSWSGVDAGALSCGPDAGPPPAPACAAANGPTLTEESPFDEGSTAEPGPDAVAAADLNLDGWSDLLVLNPFEHSLAVLLGRPDGGFAALQPFVIGAGARALAVADFNGDCLPDVALAASAGVSIFYGNGDGTFRPGPTFAASLASNYTVEAMAAGDLAGDGLTDLAVQLYAGQELSVSVILALPDGGFAAPVETSIGGASASGIAIADFNGDGRNDVAATTFQMSSGSAGVSVLLNKGWGQLGSPRFQAAGETPAGLAVGDFDRDGRLDLALTDSIAAELFVMLGDGDGGFLPAVSYPVVSSCGPQTASGCPAISPVGAALLDANGDGVLDLAVANESDDTAALFLGLGDGGFAPAEVFQVGAISQPSPVALTSFAARATDYPRDLAVLCSSDGASGTAGTVTLLWARCP
ncbi:MAG: FG-GAP repeat domain-containing protein [Deltaproteobacteria bacterium]